MCYIFYILLDGWYKGSYITLSKQLFPSEKYLLLSNSFYIFLNSEKMGEKPHLVQIVFNLILLTKQKSGSSAC